MLSYGHSYQVELRSCHVCCASADAAQLFQIYSVVLWPDPGCNSATCACRDMFPKLSLDIVALCCASCERRYVTGPNLQPGLRVHEKTVPRNGNLRLDHKSVSCRLLSSNLVTQAAYLARGVLPYCHVARVVAKHHVSLERQIYPSFGILGTRRI